MSRYVAYYASAGCLPDSEPHYFESARDAWEWVASELEWDDNDETYLDAHTALHVLNRDAPGSLPHAGLYSWHVEPVEV